jgi:hypothetical protein
MPPGMKTQPCQLMKQVKPSSREPLPEKLLTPLEGDDSAGLPGWICSARQWQTRQSDSGAFGLKRSPIGCGLQCRRLHVTDAKPAV